MGLNEFAPVMIFFNGFAPVMIFLNGFAPMALVMMFFEWVCSGDDFF